MHPEYSGGGSFDAESTPSARSRGSKSDLSARTMKGDISLYLYLALFVMIGIILLIFVSAALSPLASEAGRTQELAITAAISLDALSSTDEGLVRLDAGSRRYDIEIVKKDMILRRLGSAITPGILDNGYYVFVTPQAAPQNESSKKQGPRFFLIRSYGLAEDHETKLSGVSSICIEKKPLEEIARLVTCA